MSWINKLLYKLGATNVKKGKNVKIHPSQKSLRIDGKIRIEDNVKIISHDSLEHVVMGNGTKICEGATILTAGGNINIGTNCQIGGNNYFTCQGNIKIGDNVLFASNVSIISSEHNYQDVSVPIMNQGSRVAPVEIGDDSWLGINVTVLSGTTIGKHCVVGANSLVRGQFPDYCVIAGNPARILKRYDAIRDEWVRESFQE